MLSQKDQIWIEKERKPKVGEIIHQENSRKCNNILPKIDQAVVAEIREIITIIDRQIKEMTSGGAPQANKK